MDWNFSDRKAVMENSREEAEGSSVPVRAAQLMLMDMAL